MHNQSLSELTGAEQKAQQNLINDAKAFQNQRVADRDNMSDKAYEKKYSRENMDKQTKAYELKNKYQTDILNNIKSKERSNA